MPLELFTSFFIAAGPIFCKWSAEGLVIIESQITASLTISPFPSLASVEFGHEADTYTKTCFVFQVKRDERSADREKRIMAYSSFLVE